MSVFLFDGDCGFCTRCAEFLRRNVDTPAQIVAWRSVDLAPLGVTAQQCSEAVQYVSGGQVSAGPVAIAGVLRSARQPWWRVVGTALGLRPVLAAAWPAYRLVARYRHRLPGGTAACEVRPAPVPPPPLLRDHGVGRVK